MRVDIYTFLEIDSNVQGIKFYIPYPYDTARQVQYFQAMFGITKFNLWGKQLYESQPLDVSNWLPEVSKLVVTLLNETPGTYFYYLTAPGFNLIFCLWCFWIINYQFSRLSMEQFNELGD